MGGHFERLVQTIKVSLATAILRKLLTLEEFRTVVLEAEKHCEFTTTDLPVRFDERCSLITIAIGLGKGPNPHASTAAARRPTGRGL